MINESNKIIVKVGKKSNLRFANSKVYRAITANDLNLLVKNHSDCKIIVIESISEDEQDAVKDFAISFKAMSDDNAVLFYIPTNDEITSGIADELDYNIYLTDRDLYKYIYEAFGINVSVYIDDRKRLNSEELSESIPDGITDIFGGIGDESENDISDAIAAIDEVDKNAEKENIENIESIDNKESNIDKNIEKNDKVSLTKKDENIDKKESNIDKNAIKDINKIESVTLEKTDTTPKVESKKVKEEKNIVNEANDTLTTNVDRPIAKETIHLENNKGNIETEKTEQLNSNATLESLSSDAYNENDEASKEVEDRHLEMTADTEEYIEELKMKIRDAKYDYNEVLKDMREANSRIESLENIIRLLREEKDNMQKRMDELMISDEVIEDPISLSEYGVIKDNASKLEGQILDLNSTITMLKGTIESKELDINSAEATMDELKQTVSSLREQLTAANQTIKEDEKYKEESEEYKEQLDKALADNKKLHVRIESAEDENRGLNDELTETTIRADKESSVRLEMLEQLKSAILRIRELSVKLNRLDESNRELTSKIAHTEKQLKDSRNAARDQLEKIAKLEKAVQDSDKKLEIASNSSDAEKAALNDKISQLKNKLNMIENQLRQKENQYNTLVETSGVDENSAKALLDTNKTLENISKTLREQLATANKELDRVKRSEADAAKKMNNYKNQVATLQRSLQSLASVGTGVGSSDNVSVRPIHLGYTKSQIITVFGSGSFGITTTAMSLAQKLSATSKVLYIDFDLVSPMADSWFKRSPILNNIPGTVNGSLHNTGLGLFIEQGVDTIGRFTSKIIIPVSNTKGGGIHYLSGLYYRPDAYKLATANYDEFFSILGNNFQYIIIDFGRLGSSEISDQLIKAVSDISFKNIVVTTTNNFEIRNFKNKLNDLHIRLDNVAWLFNMCTTTALDPKVKELVKPCSYDMLPRMEQYGAQENFLRVNLTRDRFGYFIDRTVFGR